MYIRIGPGGELSLQDCDNLRSFAIRPQSVAADLRELDKIGTPAEDRHYWLDADAVQELSARKHDQQWVRDYRAMLDSVAPYGYFDKTTNKVKAHVETENE